MAGAFGCGEETACPSSSKIGPELVHQNTLQIAAGHIKMLQVLTKALKRSHTAQRHAQRFFSSSQSSPAEDSSKTVPFSKVNIDRDPTYKSEIQGHSDDRGNAPITGQGRSSTSYDVVDPSGPERQHRASIPLTRRESLQDQGEKVNYPASVSY